MKTRKTSFRSWRTVTNPFVWPIMIQWKWKGQKIKPLPKQKSLDMSVLMLSPKICLNSNNSKLPLIYKSSQQRNNILAWWWWRAVIRRPGTQREKFAVVLKKALPQPCTCSFSRLCWSGDRVLIRIEIVIVIHISRIMTSLSSIVLAICFLLGLVVPAIAEDQDPSANLRKWVPS